jgi:hypothetical protein
MTNPKSRIVAAVAGALSMGATVAWAAEPTQTEVKLQELQAKVAQLEAQQAQNSKDVAATIDSVLRDAEHRSQLLATGGEGAGYDNGFYLRTGSWELRPGVLFQFWNDTDWRENTSPNGKDQIDNGFEVHHLELSLEGTAFSKDLTYRFMWDSAPEGGSLTLQDAWARWMFSDQIGVRMGQFKDLLTHEWLTGDGYQLAAERSVVDFILGGGFVQRTQGVTLVYGGYEKGNPLNVEVGFTDGLNQQNTNFVSKGGSGFPGAAHTFDFGITGRAEYLAMGNWKDYADFSAMGTKENLLVFGLGTDWSQSGDGDVVSVAIDGQFEMPMGLSLYGGGLYRWADKNITGLGSETNDYGLIAQAGYLLNPAWEIFGRYDWTHFDKKIVSGDRNFHEFTVGVNYFLGNNGSAGHRAKFTVDLSYLPNGVPGALIGSGLGTTLGATGDNAGDNEVMLRAQFQLML